MIKNVKGTSVDDLATNTRTFVNGWNERCHPFTWTKPADENLAKRTVHPFAIPRQWTWSLT